MPSVRVTSPIAAIIAAYFVVAGLTSPASAAEFHAVAIGDSVMLGAKSQLLKAGFDRVDAKVSRQASTGPGLVKKLAASPDVQFVVIHLGTNGSYSVDMCRDMVRAAGADRTVLLINLKVPRKWEVTNNKLMKQCAQGFSASRVQILDWNTVAQTKDSYLYSDGMHLTPVGAKKFTRMITSAIKKTITWQGRVTPGTR